MFVFIFVSMNLSRFLFAQYSLNCVAFSFPCHGAFHILLLDRSAHDSIRRQFFLKNIFFYLFISITVLLFYFIKL